MHFKKGGIHSVGDGMARINLIIGAGAIMDYHREASTSEISKFVFNVN